MENWTCNSFYDKDGQTAQSKTSVLSNNLTQKGILATEEDVPVLTIAPEAIETVSEPETKPVVKKRSTLWIWAASYFAAILISPSENINYIDNSKTNVTP